MKCAVMKKGFFPRQTQVLDSSERKYAKMYTIIIYSMIQKNPYKTGMVFGVFDGLHPGHQFFLSEAAKQCETLIVVVALDAVVTALKQHTPRYSFTERVSNIEQFNSALRVVPSDTAVRSWAVLKKHQPDIIFLGHDQTALAQALDDIAMPYTILDAHYPEKYKSSILHGTEK